MVEAVIRRLSEIPQNSPPGCLRERGSLASRDPVAVAPSHPGIHFGDGIVERPKPLLRQDPTQVAEGVYQSRFDSRRNGNALGREFLRVVHGLVSQRIVLRGQDERGWMQFGDRLCDCWTNARVASRSASGFLLAGAYPLVFSEYLLRRSFIATVSSTIRDSSSLDSSPRGFRERLKP